jgi:hypothetical protein
MDHRKFSSMSKVQEIERAVEQLPPEVFSELVEWIDQRRGKIIRDHGAFLNSYAPDDEGLYDDAVAR